MSKLERVARAICTVDEQNGGVPWDGLASFKMTKESYYDQARAVLRELREPDEEMRAAMARLNHPRDEEIWQAGIDAILGGE